MSKIFAVLLYIVIVVSIGFLSSKRLKNTSGFALGNRNLNYWVTAISANASDMSVWLFLGFPVAVYSFGLIQIWVAIGLIFFMFLNWHFVAPKLRTLSEEHNCLTIFSLFEKRLNDHSHTIRVLGAITSSVFLTIYIAAGMTGMGYLFESLFGFNYTLGCILAVVGILIYTNLGGFTAICYTDFFQGIFLLFVILLVPSLILLSNFPHNLRELDSNVLDGFLPRDLESLFMAFTLSFGWGLGYFGQPHILNKFMAIKDPSDLGKSKYLGTVWQILALLGAVLCGISAHYFFKDQAPANVELIFVDMVNSLFSPFFASFLLCAILAATLSTIDSQILVVASVIAEDIFKIFVKKDGVKMELFVSRIASILISLLALIIALNKPASIYNLVNYCWVAIGSSFGPLLIAVLYLKNINKTGALCGMIVGALIGSLWIGLNTKISAMLPGFVFGFFTIFIISKISNKIP